MQNELTLNITAISMTEKRSDDEVRAASVQMQALIVRARSGDADAFEAIMLHYQQQVLSIARRLLGNVDDARDAAQEVFLRLHKYLGRFDERKELLPWLYRMTVNVCHDIGRNRRAGTLVSLEQEQAQGNLAALQSQHDIEAEISTAQEKQIIAAALAELSEKERAAVVLRDLAGLATNVVAQILNSSESTVRSQISTARVKIKRHRDRVLSKGKET